MRRARPVRAVPVGAALALSLLSGCAGSAAADPTASVTGARAKVVAARTSKVLLTSTTAIGAQTVSFTGTGAYDYGKQAGTLQLSVGGPGGRALREIVTGGNLYLALPDQGGSYYRVALADVAGTSLGSSTDPTAPLASLQGIAGAVTKVGSEQVRGSATTHYRGSIDVAKAVGRARGAQRDLLTATLQGSGLRSVPFDAYVDAQGRLRKYVQVVRVPGSARTGGLPLTSTTTTELYDFGTPVTVTAPPASAVKDGAPLLQALRAGRAGH